MKISHLLLLMLLPLVLFTACETTDNTDDVLVIEDEEVVTPIDNPADDSGNNNNEPLESLVLTDVSYGDHPQQVYDIYLPEGRTAMTTKVVVLIHGGGWTSGDKASMEPFVQYFLTNHPDHAIINLNYVLSGLPGPPAFPNQYLDIDAAVNQIIAQQEELQILPEFGFLGTSAGAHLAMMYDYTYDTDDLVKFVIDIVGPTDFTDPFFTDDPNFPIALALLADASQFPAGTDLAIANSPALVANSSSSPTLLFYGDQDPLVPLSNGQNLADALSLLEIENTFTINEGGHGGNWSDAARLDLEIKTSAAIDNYLAIE